MLSPALPPADVLVVGGGIAALCAAIAARRAGASVVLAEAAPRHLRGGNTRHSRNLRFAHTESPLAPGRYGEDEFLADLAAAASGAHDPALAALVARRSAEVPVWLAGQGVAFQTAHLPYSRKTAFFLGGGTAAANALYATAERLGVRVLYDHPVGTVPLEDGGTTIVACGGAQADLSHGFVNRGTPFATGAVLRALLDQGTAASGRPDAAHLVAVDSRSPEHDGGIVTRVDGMELGMVVDAAGRRFLDETTVTGQTRYARWGQLVAALPGRRAALVLDAEGLARAPLAVFPPLRAETLADLAAALDADAGELARSAAESGRVARPPFGAFPIRPGITFTGHGVGVDGTMRVVRTDGAACPGLFAAGMIMAPNVLGAGYAAGCGLTIGAVTGRIAGEEAARHALG